MSLLTDLPHRITVQTPAYGTDGSGGTIITGWNNSAAGVACEITPTGGSVAPRFAGDLLGDEIDVFLMSAVITQGCRVQPTTPNTGNFYQLSSGIGPCPAEGTIPTTYRYHFSRVTATT